MHTPTGPGKSNGNWQSSGGTDVAQILGQRADALWRRLVDIEEALAVQEWWMLGRAVPVASLLAEVGSLLAVARGEMENALNLYFGRNIPRRDITDQYSAVSHDAPVPDDEMWVQASRDQAMGLLRLVAGSLPPMYQYAQMLRAYADQYGLPSGSVDAFGIVADRLSEIGEALKQPPQ